MEDNSFKRLNFLRFYLKTIFFFKQKTSQQQLDQVDNLANAIAQENIGIACAFIQKTAAEKAVLDIDKRFAAVSSFLRCDFCS